MNKKLYTEKQASISAALAGPIPAGILIFLNYKALGKEREAYNTLAVTLLATALLVYGLIQLPEEITDRIPNFVFTVVYGVIVYAFYHRYLTADVNKALEEGAIVGSNWTVAGVSIVGLLITVMIVFGLSLNQPFYEGELLKTDGNELYHDAQIPPGDVAKLVKELKNTEYFAPDFGNIARLQEIGGEYFITLLVEEEYWSDPEIISYVTNIKWVMEVEFGRKTNLKLESVSLSGVSKFKIITN